MVFDKLDNVGLNDNKRSTKLLNRFKFFNCRSPDFKSPIGPPKNREKPYNRVVVWVFGRNAGYNNLIQPQQYTVAIKCKNFQL